MSGTASYAVHATVSIRGNAAQVLRALGRQVLDLDRKLSSLQAKLQTVSSGFAALGTSTHAATAGMVGSINSVVGATTNLNQAIRRSGASITRQTTRMTGNAAAATRMAAAMNQAAASAGRLAGIRLPRLGGGGAGGGGHGGDAWRSPLLNPTRYEAVAAARSGARGIWSVLEAGGAEQEQATRFRARGYTPEEQARVEAAVPELARGTPGVTTEDVYKAITFAMGTVGEMGTALELVPELLRAGRLSGTFTGKDVEHGLQPLLRSLAIKGSFTDRQGNLTAQGGVEDLRILQSAMIAFGEELDPREILMFFKQAGIAGREMSMEAVAGPVASVITEMGGARTGTSTQAFRDNVVSGVMTKEKRRLWEAAGLIQKDTRWQSLSERDIAALQERGARGDPGGIGEEEADELRRSGGYRAISGGVVGRALARERQDLWVQEVLMPMLSKLGFHTETEMLDQVEKLGIGGRQTGRRLVMGYMQTREVRNDIRNQQRVRRAQLEAQRGFGENPTDIILRQGFKTQVAGVQASWQNMLAAAGRSEGIIKLLSEISRGFEDIAQQLRDNPRFVEEGVKFAMTTLREVRETMSAAGTLIRETNAAFQAVKGWFSGVSDLMANTVREIQSIWSWITGGGAGLGRPEGDTLRGENGIAGRGTRNFGARGLIYDRGEVRLPGGAAEVPTNPLGVPQTPLSLNPRLSSFSPVPPPGDVVVQTALVLDGRQIAEVVTRHQGAAATAPPRSAVTGGARRGLLPSEGILT